ncbi:glycosyltransferase family 17 protein [Schizophyllum amplum]|uniref:Glycosyltransferase family 17 protein n=1 Tax=Schizophyllum amplum TaxID=97359 RepID=A0A550CWL0_9AGAR|nr:glycosyltransferase family 17 protein [Auriculariopsis ampla]
MSILRSRRFQTVLLPASLLTFGLLYLISQNHYQIRNTLSYATRPLWDTADGPKHVVPHYYADGLGYGEGTCHLHGWPQREENERNALKVIDAVLMSSELDLLEVRLNELDSVVDRFFILESNATFTGLPKETYFEKNRERFAKFKNKIEYHLIPGYPLAEGQSAFDVEGHTRNYMTRLIRGHLTEFPPHVRTLVLMSDVDEIPARHTVDLLKNCDFGPSVHLQMRNYVYSFEWFVGFNSWRAQAHIWNKESYYRHSMSSEYALADAGWHCSYCFRTIPEYSIKMQGFSHHDRIGGRLDLLDPARIQKTICQGKDIFGMLPEAYNYVDLLSQLRLEPQTTAVGLPRFVMEEADRFRFLLPGGCMREDAKDGSAIKPDMAKEGALEDDMQVR